MALHITHFALAALLALGCGGGDSSGLQTGDPADTALVVESTDPAVADAQAALAEGRPWRATQVLAPALASPERRTPEVVLLAATAASGWGGWAEVERLLAAEPWIDTHFDGRARTLLARAALARGADTAAVQHAEAALRAAPSTERGMRLVLLARALDRLDAFDSSRVMYERAAAQMPDVGEWLRLRAAGVSADSAQRARYHAAIRSAVPRERIAQAEAVTRERTGDIPGAIRVHEQLGNRVAVLRLRAATSSDPAELATVRRELMALIGSRAGTGDARTATEILDGSFTPLSAAEELLIARSAFRSGPAARAITAYERALGEGQGTSRDRFNYASLLSRVGRDRDAARQFARVTSPHGLAADAAYQRARSMLRAGDGNVKDALRGVLSKFADDTGAASIALLLLADLATDEQRDEAARSAYRDLVRSYPTSSHAPRAWFSGALIAYANGTARTAAQEWDSLRARHPRSGEATPATYWAGRAWARAGDSTKARQRWQAVIDREPQSYYAILAARRLGVEPWAPPPAADSIARDSLVDEVMARVDLLERLGMDFEAGLEYAALVSDSVRTPQRLLALGAALRERQQSSRTITVGTRLLEQGVRDSRAYRLVYPVVHGDVLAAEARERELDPALVAGLIRQESWFDPRATSAAGARGLMQVMPAVGRQIAQRLDYPVWDVALLHQPDVNVELGTTHMSGLFRTYDRIEHILAAYNAGGSRVERWLEKRGVEDPEVFVERIPFVETRDYVRIVLRNRELYRSLYGW